MKEHSRKRYSSFLLFLLKQLYKVTTQNLVQQTVALYVLTVIYTPIIVHKDIILYIKLQNKIYNKTAYVQ